mmetsp:Transcript_2021/g.5148  ORF Transcript_2021/g.5148 Transcript_2021/m.5148 type:complete len:275 (-) Transcript_2021:6224-7048(-)
MPLIRPGAMSRHSPFSLGYQPSGLEDSSETPTLRSISSAAKSITHLAVKVSTPEPTSAAATAGSCVGASVTSTPSGGGEEEERDGSTRPRINRELIEADRERQFATSTSAAPRVAPAGNEDAPSPSPDLNVPARASANASFGGGTCAAFAPSSSRANSRIPSDSRISTKRYVGSAASSVDVERPLLLPETAESRAPSSSPTFGMTSPGKTSVRLDDPPRVTHSAAPVAFTDPRPFLETLEPPPPPARPPRDVARITSSAKALVTTRRSGVVPAT